MIFFERERTMTKKITSAELVRKMADIFLCPICKGPMRVIEVPFAHQKPPAGQRSDRRIRRKNGNGKRMWFNLLPAKKRRIVE
ncbi:hypothetical protein B4135_4270 [Caldibacillus debilis]|uniref:Uncharacterized protein n=1 Tax=Caldibacillus debilis TaxID=301148 RepID=A0A150L6A7_9BACI|nr:hypothetical protein B4135_4270 [Caldibacillus debilis]